MATSSCMGLSCQDVVAQGPPTDLGGHTSAPDASSDAPLPLLKPVCGAGSCVPDDGQSCAQYVPPATGSNGGDRDSDAGADSEHESDAGSDDLDAGVGDAGRDARLDGSFSRPTPQEPAPSSFSCQLTLVRSDAVERTCAPAGTRRADEACTSSLDCAPGLGCVGSVRAGRCLPYCCGVDGDSCESGSYCAPRPLRSPDLGEADGPLVPVCDRAENCSLAEPANCTGEHCVCAAGTACSVVRPDGTTACVPEGSSVAGGPCPCKWGYYCSQATSPASCVKTCELSVTDSCGTTGVCQATPLLPDGWGTCVGTALEPKP